jgi:hypothetical protein
LLSCSCFFNSKFWNPRFDGFGHSKLFHFFNKFPRMVSNFMRQTLLVTSSPRIDCFSDFVSSNRSVFLAILAEKSVGKAIASSMHWYAVFPKSCRRCFNTCYIIKGSCSVKLQPLVWQCVLKANDLASVGLNCFTNLEIIQHAS